MADDFELTGVQTESDRLDASIRRAEADGVIVEVDVVDVNINIGRKPKKNKKVQSKKVQAKISKWLSKKCKIPKKVKRTRTTSKQVRRPS